MPAQFSFLNFVDDTHELLLDHLARRLRSEAVPPESVTLWTDDEDPTQVVLCGKRRGRGSVERTLPAALMTDTSRIAELEAEVDRYHEAWRGRGAAF